METCGFCFEDQSTFYVICIVLLLVVNNQIWGLTGKYIHVGFLLKIRAYVIYEVYHTILHLL